MRRSVLNAVRVDPDRAHHKPLAAKSLTRDAHAAIQLIRSPASRAALVNHFGTAQ